MLLHLLFFQIVILFYNYIIIFDCMVFSVIRARVGLIRARSSIKPFVRVTFRRFLKCLIFRYYIRKKTEWGHRTLNMNGTMTTGKFNSLVNRKGELNGSYRIWWISIYYKSFDKLKEQKHYNRPVTSLGAYAPPPPPPHRPGGPFDPLSEQWIQCPQKWNYTSQNATCIH